MATFCPARGAALSSVQDSPLPRVVGLVLVQGSVSLERLTSLELAIVGGGWVGILHSPLPFSPVPFALPSALGCRS